MLLRNNKFIMGASNSGGIQYVNGRSTGLGGSTLISVSLTNLESQAGDLVILYFGATSDGVDRDWDISGYTEVAQLYSNDDFDSNLVVAYKVLTSRETAIDIPNGTFDSTMAGASAVQVWRGVDPTSPMDVTPTTATGINSPLCNPPSITPNTSGAVIVSGGVAAHGEQVETFASSDLTDFITSGADDTGGDMTIGLGYHRWTSGAFDPSAFTFSASPSSSASWAAVTLALRPA